MYFERVNPPRFTRPDALHNPATCYKPAAGRNVAHIHPQVSALLSDTCIPTAMWSGLDAPRPTFTTEVSVFHAFIKSEIYGVSSKDSWKKNIGNRNHRKSAFEEYLVSEDPEKALKLRALSDRKSENELNAKLIEHTTCLSPHPSHYHHRYFYQLEFAKMPLVVDVSLIKGQRVWFFGTHRICRNGSSV